MPPGHVTQDCPISTLHSFGWLSNRFNKDKIEEFCETSGKVCASPGVRLETSSLGMLKTLVSRTKSTFLGIKTHHKSGTGRRGSNLLRSHLKTTTTTTFKKCRGGGVQKVLSFLCLSGLRRPHPSQTGYPCKLYFPAQHRPQMTTVGSRGRVEPLSSSFLGHGSHSGFR